ncbi:pyruvate decarboxylase 1 [Ricinus communis]|uniref:pyruvate decarboxylase n=1 Tax=Ricinus communis TaxID=3988 RepID=B9RLM7_RICCO|nr:pyruvate decarboxylase 1 [Ricinus communis]EEF47752.1 pyruvate decarboxylase, putative [Ricinus communis]|eukprot:XP_002514646.1 pyruvate decarboxylase 1 [Ricinus communis]
MEKNGTVKPTSCNDGHYTSPPKFISAPTLGYHLARRLVEVGVSDIFSVPGDTTLTLFDYFIAEPGLNLIGCCNELNAGYAADGYARARGVGACAVTFTVGGLSILNAIAGAYSEHLPVICIVGGPNSNDYGSKRILHHTIGLPDFSQELQCFQAVTCHQAIINDLDNAQEQIDKAITICLQESKPVYISISCNLVAIPHPSFIHKPIPLVFTTKISNQMVLEVAVEAAAEILNKAVKPVLVAGPKLRAAKACNAFVQLAKSCGYAFAVMPAAKGLVPENHPHHFIGTYWGAASTVFCAEIVETADASLLAGPIFDDLSSLGYSLLFNKKKAIIAEPDRIIIPEMPVLGTIVLKDFLKRLAKRLDHNKTSYQNYKRIYVAEEVLPKLDPKEALKVNVMFKHIQKMLIGDMVVVAEVGDSWFHCQKLKLPQGCGYESQILYASIGWSVGATLGYAQAKPDKRVIAFIGDGSFQMSPQDVSTMLRCGHKSIIFLINNGGYTIETEIHDGPYNVINNWNYTELVNAMDNGFGRCWTAKVGCEEELIGAMETAMVDKKECLCFIEVIVHRDDTSKELLQLVCRLASANSRPPYLQMSYGN